jgi:hypothetical protein
MTLSTIVTNVANECGYTVESNVYASSETTTKQLVAMANRVNREIFESFPWPKCYASGAITLVAGQASYALPAAFSWFQYDTFWNQSQRWRVVGPISNQEYAEIRGFGLIPTNYTRFQIRGMSNNELLINPTPTSATAGQIIIFEYIADRAVKPVNWTASTVFAANAYCSYNGNYYQTAAGGTTGSTAPTHTTGSVSDGAVTWTYYAGPYMTFQANTDSSMFSESLLEQGVKELFAETHGLTTVLPKFTMQLHEEFSRAHPSKILYAGGFRGSEVFARSGTAVFGTWI